MRIYKDAKSIKGEPFPENKSDKDKTKRKKDTNANIIINKGA
jgi:hypothetical protein